jgi:hypothetical protein
MGVSILWAQRQSGKVDLGDGMKNVQTWIAINHSNLENIHYERMKKKSLKEGMKVDPEKSVT